MKNVAAIGLLVLMCFNLCGYRMLTSYLGEQAEQHLQNNIDDHSYDPQHLVELSVVNVISYANDWLDWEPYSGILQVDGFEYQCVERKLEKGKMLYRCLPNMEKNDVVKAKDQYEGLIYSFNQHQDQPSSSKSAVINNTVDFFYEPAQLSFAFSGRIIDHDKNWPDFSCVLPTHGRSVLHPPPDQA